MDLTLSAIGWVIESTGMLSIEREIDARPKERQCQGGLFLQGLGCCADTADKPGVVGARLGVEWEMYNGDVEVAYWVGEDVDGEYGVPPRYHQGAWARVFIQSIIFTILFSLRLPTRIEYDSDK